MQILNAESSHVTNSYDNFYYIRSRPGFNLEVAQFQTRDEEVDIFRPLWETNKAGSTPFNDVSNSKAVQTLHRRLARTSAPRLKFRMYPRGQSMLLKNKIKTTENGIVLAAKSKIRKEKVLAPEERF
jgi:hypothetical protein